MQLNKILNRSDPTDAFLIRCIEMDFENFQDEKLPDWSLLGPRLESIGFKITRTDISNNRCCLFMSPGFKTYDYSFLVEFTFDDMKFNFLFETTNSLEYFDCNNAISSTHFNYYQKESQEQLCIVLRCLNLIIT